jgi:hypothetical protein
MGYRSSKKQRKLFYEIVRKPSIFFADIALNKRY